MLRLLDESRQIDVSRQTDNPARRSARGDLINLMCGSGTFLAELDPFEPAVQPAKQPESTAGIVRHRTGIDNDIDALILARANIAAAGQVATTALLAGDVTRLPLPAASFDTLLADLPFGHHIGDHETNLSLYPALLHEAARIARPGARFALITHEIRLMQKLLSAQQHWHIAHQRQVSLRGLHPQIFILQRTTA